MIFLKHVIIYNSYFEGYNRIATKTSINNSYIGIGTYIGSDSHIDKCRVGRFCCIADKLKVGLGAHPFSRFVSCHPAFYSPSEQAGFTFFEGKSAIFEEYKYASENNLVVIGNDVWIGYNVLILDGVKVGDGAILAAGSVITKDVAPYTIVGGTPAKFLKQRFNDEDIQFLLKFCWWNKDLEWIKSNKDFFIDIDFFKSRHFSNNIAIDR